MTGALKNARRASCRLIPQADNFPITRRKSFSFGRLVKNCPTQNRPAILPPITIGTYTSTSPKWQRRKRTRFFFTRSVTAVFSSFSQARQPIGVSFTIRQKGVKNRRACKRLEWRRCKSRKSKGSPVKRKRSLWNFFKTASCSIARNDARFSRSGPADVPPSDSLLIFFIWPLYFLFGSAASGP